MKPYVSIYADEDDTMTKNKTNSKNLSENDYIEDHKLIAKNDVNNNNKFVINKLG